MVDIDGTLCPVKGREERYEDVCPYPEMLERLRSYKKNGARIVLFTSRNMNSYQGNLGLINKHTAKILLEWLERWEVPYDEILYGKPWPGQKGFYVDDRSVRPDEFLGHTPQELEEICRKSRCAGTPEGGQQAEQADNAGQQAGQADSAGQQAEQQDRDIQQAGQPDSAGQEIVLCGKPQGEAEV